MSPTQTLGYIRQCTTGGVNIAPLQPCPLLANQTYTIGREPSCEIALDPHLYTGVSRRHSLLRPVNHQPGAWELVDLGSANGTYYNQQVLNQGQSQILQSGDRFTLGEDGPEFEIEYGYNTPTIATGNSFQPSIPPITASPNTPIAPDSNPQGQDQLTFTQLFPIASTGKDLRRKGLLVPGIATVIFVVLMFMTIGNTEAFNIVLGIYLAAAAYLYIYKLCGKDKPWWLLLATVIFTMILLVSPVLSLFIVVFREILPGNIDNASSLFGLFISMFFGAGLMEELLKAIPIFGCYLLGKNFEGTKRDRLGVWEPLDGILIGTASAVGFTLVETLVQYVPETQMTEGDLAGTQLLIARILGTVAGHVAYSGYFGYFIGLSVMKPQQKWKILAIGYFTASLLHALWNTMGSYSIILLTVVGMFSYAFLAAAVLKAREISPTRSENFATRFKNN
ncbi:MAG: PrsW family intramembrane metalloprotease [Synechococcaceae cyanobacterium RL_1_2]|nr:PrsW family intramembrane metalloprotease [Synechococcaceae cyanobacterium RL_1_2]